MRLQQLQCCQDGRYVIFIIETSHEKDSAALDNVRNLLGGKSRDFITAVDEKNIIVVKELSDKDGNKELEKMAKEMLDTLQAEGGDEQIHIAYGTIVSDIKEVSKSYKEAKLALDVGKIFFDEKDIVAYTTLGIGRLIYQLPLPLCKMFIKEIFEAKSPDDFDEETLTTINKFFENSLNVSETSRQLYIHRNTLVYRLDKLQKSTGLDLRVFEDAITFKIALMVVKYMKYMEQAFGKRSALVLVKAFSPKAHREGLLRSGTVGELKSVVSHHPLSLGRLMRIILTSNGFRQGHLAREDIMLVQVLLRGMTG